MKYRIFALCSLVDQAGMTNGRCCLSQMTIYCLKYQSVTILYQHGITSHFRKGYIMKICKINYQNPTVMCSIVGWAGRRSSEGVQGQS